MPNLIAVVGPTGAGKSALAIDIAKHIIAKGGRAEIINSDSMQFYKGMDIGTAKPTREELAEVPHHLIDIHDPLQAYSAAEFVRDASALVADIQTRGKTPLLVGGTMLYFKALFDGLDDMPPADPAVRAVLEAQANALGWPAMHAALAEVDPVTAARLEPADSQRIQRALEVYRITGLPLSHFHTTRNTTKTIAACAHSTGATSIICLEPNDRAWLHARIAQRFDAMLANGFLDEVRALRNRGDLHPDLPSMRCVGYRQAWEAIDGKFPMAELRERGVAATRQLAKRQITWLRSMPKRQTIACDAPDALQQVLRQVLTGASLP